MRSDIADLRNSRDLYAEAFSRAPDDYYTGINAASKSVLLGLPADLKAADQYAEKVQEVVKTEPKAGDYWLSATVAEIFLIRRSYSDAGRVYDAAVRIAPKEIASHESTWRQACRLMKVLQPSAEDRALIRNAFSHLPDCPLVLIQES